VNGKGWQKGKFRIRVALEFIPDEPENNQPESPLDDIRQQMNQNQ
ncbi:MAG: KGK domain-containing protein, partial [Halothece sp.]